MTESTGSNATKTSIILYSIYTMAGNKITYPKDWDMDNLWLEKPQTIDQDCLFKKAPILDIQQSFIKNYTLMYLKQYDLKSNINNTLKTFIEKERSYKREDLYKPNRSDFKTTQEFEAYQSNAQHLFQLYGEWDATISIIKTLREQLLDVKRFPKDG